MREGENVDAMHRHEDPSEDGLDDAELAAMQGGGDGTSPGSTNLACSRRASQGAPEQ